MAEISLQILDGVDRGKVFARLGTPVSIGREEGNTIQLNDERVSRFHAKIQEDQGQLVLTDLESTNGTRVNGEPVPLSILRLGDRISVGRSVLIVGSPSELDDVISASASKPLTNGQTHDAPNELFGDKTRIASGITDHSVDAACRADEMSFQLNFNDGGLPAMPAPPVDGAPTPAPELPGRLSPAQAAQLADLILFLHQRLASAIEEVSDQRKDGALQLSQVTWQRILSVEMQLARYHYRIGHPE